MIKVSIEHTEYLIDDKESRSRWLRDAVATYNNDSRSRAFLKRNYVRQMCLFATLIGADTLYYGNFTNKDFRTFGLVTRGKLLV